jgi:hypothetical protein
LFETLHNLLLTIYYQGHHIKEMSLARHAGDGKWKYFFSQKISREDTTKPDS